MACTFSFIFSNATTVVINQSKNIYSVTLIKLCGFVPVLNHWFVSHQIYISSTKHTMQQCFHPRAKHLLYRYVTPSFARHSFRVNAGETWYFYQFTVVHFHFCLISSRSSCPSASITSVLQ